METKTTARLAEWETKRLLSDLFDAIQWCERGNPDVALVSLRGMRSCLLPSFEVEMGDPQAARIACLEDHLRIAQRRIDELREAASAEEVTP